jgi:hypothetical protein
MEKFRAEAEFRFAADSLDAASADIRRLVEASTAVGFELKRVKVEPVPAGIDEDEGDWTNYGPFTD